MKRTKTFALMLALIMALLSVFPVSAMAANRPTTDDYMKISLEVMDKYDMIGKMEYGIVAVPDRTLEEHREFMEEIVSMSAYAYQRGSSTELSSEPVINGNTQTNTDASAAQTKVYQQKKSFYVNKYFNISCVYTMHLKDRNAWIAPVSEAGVRIENTILGSTSILGGLRGYIYQQTGTNVKFYTDGSGAFEAISTGNWKVSTASGIMDYGTLGIVQDFGRDEIAYARANGRFK